MKIGILIILFYSQHTIAQLYNSNSVFGDSAGLAFEVDTTFHFNSAIKNEEAGASISDSTGNLLFYTNGQQVWNKNHEVMPNGNDLEIGLVGDYASSETQGVIIVPKPENSNLYYIFQLQDHGPFGVKYSIVDINSAGGMGDVIAKNIILYDKDITEKMQVVKHGNGKDWWLILHAWPDFTATTDSTFVFITFLITSDLILGPYKQAYGPNAIIPDIPYLGWGEMVISESGDKLAYTRQNKLDIYDFDRCNGLFGNWLEVTNLPILMHYGCSISPDGSKVYVSTVGDNSSYLYQFSLVDENVDSSRQLIFENTFNNYALGQHELGPDGRIFIAMYYYGEFPNTYFTPKNQNLCVINNPNEIFPYCDFDTNTVSLGDRRVIGGLPNMPNYNLGSLTGSECDTIVSAINTIHLNNSLIISPNPATDLINLSFNKLIHDAELVIYNVQGKIVQEINLQAPNQEIQIDIQNLNPGIYFVSVKNKGELYAIEKFIKLL